jgi:hypothetical protein
MDQIAHMMSEIARLRIENAELRKNYLVRQNIMRGEPSRLRSRSIMSEHDVPLPEHECGCLNKTKSEIMFSDNKGFEQFAGPDYGSGTKAERAGFMSVQEGEIVSKESKIYQKKLHKFSNYPVGIGDKYFG